MAATFYDRASRYLLREHLALLGWLLGLPEGAYRFVRWLDAHLGSPGGSARTADTLAHLTNERDGGRPWIVLIEFQAEADPEMFGRALEYLGGAWRREKPTGHPGDRFELGLVVVNLTGRGSTSRQMRWPEAGLEMVVSSKEWNLADLDAAEVLEQIATAKAPAVVLVWIPLMKRGDEAVIIQRWKELAGQVADLRVRRDLRLAAGFAEAAKRGPVWQEALKGWDVEEPRFLIEIQAKERTSALLDVLDGRFGAVPHELAIAIGDESDVEKLRRWHSLAVRSQSLDAFRQAIGK